MDEIENLIWLFIKTPKLREGARNFRHIVHKLAQGACYRGILTNSKLIWSKLIKWVAHNNEKVLKVKTEDDLDIAGWKQPLIRDLFTTLLIPNKNIVKCILNASNYWAAFVLSANEVIGHTNAVIPIVLYLLYWNLIDLWAIMGFSNIVGPTTWAIITPPHPAQRG